MKFPMLPAALLLLMAIVVFAGCNSTSSPPVTPAIPVPGEPLNLTQLTFSKAEIPFTIRGEKTQNPNMKDPTLSQFGAIRGLTRYVINEPADSATAIQIGQTIVEYPPGNAVRAFDTFVNLTRGTVTDGYTITWLPDPGIGAKSCAFSVADSSAPEKSFVMMVFVKGDIMESVTMIGPAQDLDTLTRVTRIAAAKIPS